MQEDLYVVAKRYKNIEKMINALATKSQANGSSITELFNSLNLSQEVTKSFHYVRKERNKVIHEVVALADRSLFEQSCDHVVKALNGYVDNKIAKLEEDTAGLRSLKNTFSTKTPQPPPPPPPLPQKSSLKVGDRVESNVGGVSFFERVIPAPPNGKPFMIMETQVTQALYRAVTGQNPSCLKGKQRPVEQVSWQDGIAFCNALSKKLGLSPAYKGVDNNCKLITNANGFRLPFEAEWAFAAVGGQDSRYSGSINLDEVGWYRRNSRFRTHSVGEKKANGYGLYDMSGNVWEWCADDYDNPGQHCHGASMRSYRGGGWDDDAFNCEVSSRFRGGSDLCLFNIGLRLCRSLE